MISLTPAVIELEIALNIVKTNEPINRKEGDIEQANLEKRNAKAFELAIDVLNQAKVKKGNGQIAVGV